MMRNCIKFFNKNSLGSTLENRKNVFKRTLFVPRRTSTETQFSAKPDLQSLRYKTNTSKKKQESESDSDDKEEFTDEIQDKNTKILNIKLTSLRVDAILKTALGIARNKVETQFYESKIRVNGDKILKKSATIQVGDEIDLLKGPDFKNPNFINVARVEILSIKPSDESILVKIRRCKSLTIEPY